MLFAPPGYAQHDELVQGLLADKKNPKVSARSPIRP
jgi:hypothetical protein